ncbi:MAG: hypothetical protein HY016_05365 [Nitrosomonadales bacterium]|nr:hypothetical protein [Nitrosomonadales bacterium]
MKEEQAVLDFFARTENLPLGLAVAEQMDELRVRMNTRFWQELHVRLQALIAAQQLPWHIEMTGDKNAPDSLLGLHCSIVPEQALYLRPMLEQQHLGGAWRIYFGLIWSAPPSPAQLTLPDVTRLKAALQNAGFKSNENFLAWQWTAFHPRRKDFLLRHAQQPEKLLDEVAAIFSALLIEHRALIEQANTALQSAPRGLTGSLNQLRDELID